MDYETIYLKDYKDSNQDGASEISNNGVQETCFPEIKNYSNFWVKVLQNSRYNLATIAFKKLVMMSTTYLSCRKWFFSSSWHQKQNKNQRWADVWIREHLFILRKFKNNKSLGRAMHSKKKVNVTSIDVEISQKKLTLLLFFSLLFA